MRVFRDTESFPRFRHAAVTVGSYDGVHLGHQRMIGCAIRAARERDGESVVITFNTHPRMVLGRGEGMQLLTTLDEKLRLMESLGVDNVIVLEFTPEFAALSGEDFIRRVLIERVGAELLVVGYNHRFGHDRVDYRTAEAVGMEVIRVGQYTHHGQKVSSTVIRQLIDKGDIAAAEELLGHEIKQQTL